MKKMLKRSVCLLVVCLLFLLSGILLAQGLIDTARRCALTVHYTHEEVPLGSVAFRLYDIGRVSQTWLYTIDEKYEAYQIGRAHV